MSSSTFSSWLCAYSELQKSLSISITPSHSSAGEEQSSCPREGDAEVQRG
jgi:hypothetical protein